MDSNPRPLAGHRPRVVILGGGFGGGFLARALERYRRRFEVVLIDRHNYLTFYPLMIEAGVGAIEPRHVVVPLRKLCHHTDLRVGEVQRVDVRDRTVWYLPVGEDEEEAIGYDELVLAVGSVTRLPHVPGLQEYGFEMKTLNDAISLRDRGIQLMEMANNCRDAEQRRKYLTFIVVGGNFTGVELAGEFQAFLTDLLTDYPNVRREEIRVLLFEHNKTILPNFDDELAKWATKELTQRGVQITNGPSVAEIGEDYAILTTGERIPTYSVYWTAGIKPPPVLDWIEGLPRNERGYVVTGSDLKVKDLPHVWALGDLAAVTNELGKAQAPTAQVAVRQGPFLARNLVRSLDGLPTEKFNFDPIGAFAAIGHRKAAALVKGRRFKGVFGWLLYRGAYFAKIPGVAVKTRLLADWILEILFKSPPVQMGLHQVERRVPSSPSEREPVAAR